jgi:hypothetical protein
MRRSYGFLILSLTGLCGAVAIPHQEDPPAEKVFKNITTMKGAKASDIIPSMHFISASLNVKCEFCHAGQDFASDAKGPKHAAREMIEMQREINAKNFGGRNQVTCATCHAGHTHPIPVPPVEGATVRAQRSADVKPGDVLAAYGKAVNADAAKSISGLHLQGTNLSMGVKSDVSGSYSAGKFTYTTKTPKGDQRQGFNGTMGWITNENGVQQFPAVYGMLFLNEKLIFTGPDSLPKLTGLGGATATIDGKDMLVITGTEEDKTRVTLYFDKKSGLLSRTMFSYPSILGNLAQTNDYSNYRKVGGVLLPTKIINHATDGDQVQEFHSVKVDNAIDATVFDPPKK